MSIDTLIRFTDEELEAFLFADPEPAPVSDANLLAFNDELRTLARRLAGQHTDVVGMFVAEVFSRPPGFEGSLAQVVAVVDSLLRLSSEVEDVVLFSHLSGLRGLLSGGVPDSRREHSAFLRELRERVIGLSDLLDPEAGKRLRELVHHEGRRHPLLAELASLRGVGPYRLTRLYCAGLYTVDAMRTADPVEVSECTGIPLRLARQIVRASQDYAERRRRRCAEDLRTLVAELREIAAREDLEPAERANLSNAAHSSILALHDLLDQFVPLSWPVELAR